MKVLAGDIGGTNSRLALVAVDASGACALSALRSFRNADFPSFEAVLDAYGGAHLAGLPMALAVAGPVGDGRVQLTNRGWDICAATLQARYRCSALRLFNDFEAAVYGVDTLCGDGVRVLQCGAANAAGLRLLVGAGTGFGVAFGAVHDDGTVQACSTEGGHIAFAPRNAVQDELLAFMRARHGRVSVERLLSGAGIEALHAFCRERHDQRPGPAPDAAGVVAAARAGDSAAAAAVALFVELLGQVTGDLALATGARGGVHVAGGIAPQLGELLDAATFCTAFADKGRFAAWMAALPVSLVKDPWLGLKGAALALRREMQACERGEGGG